MDFFNVRTRSLKNGEVEVYPDFLVGRSKDLMVRSRAFYAIWDEEANLWSTDEYDVQRIIDEELRKYADTLDGSTTIKYTQSFSSNSWNQFKKYVSQLSDNSHELDSKLVFANTPVKKSDYVSRRLPYNLTRGDHSAWDELIDVIYSPEEREKIEWAIGSIVSGDSKKIQKFLVFYGPPGTGKSTVLNIIQKLFEGYTTSFEAKALGMNGNAFATEIFKSNPLVAIQHDGDLSRIEDNTKLNSIISHEEMTMNEKYKASYTSKINALLFMGTNKPVKISDAKAGLIRRLIDVNPTGEKINPNHYNTLMSRIDFELGAIAKHCLDIYQSLGKNHFNNYRPLSMMFQTNIFFNFIESYYDVFKSQDSTTLKQAYTLYKEFCKDTGVEHQLPQHKVREELANYFSDFKDRIMLDGEQIRSYYSGFSALPFKTPVDDKNMIFSLVMDETISGAFDLVMADAPAQYAKEDGTPQTYWANVKTRLADVDTSKLHYVRLPDNHIVIDFDLKDDDGRKSLERNLEAASEFPATYGELSKSGDGVHLHYVYDGDVEELAREFLPGIEIKVFTGHSSLRRRLSRCNNVPIATISSGLPFKERKVISVDAIQSEKGLRDLISRNLRKEVHPGTKPSIDFIHHILQEAYDQGMSYDVTDMRNKIVAFANNSSNQPLQALKIVQKMRFQGATASEKSKAQGPEDLVKVSWEPTSDRLVFFDIEVYPNLLVVCWKYQGDKNVTRMINPSSKEIEALLKLKLIGFNNRRYDNHILYARFMGYNNEMVYNLSKKIIENNVGSMFGEAYGLSYTDIYDFSSKKQGLKKFQIELGIPHVELDLPWDEPVDPALWPKVVEYCVNDVESTEVVFEARRSDFAARQILADLSGLSVNDTTQKHTAKIVFDGDPNPQRSFVYTDLSKDFPGYIHDRGKSTYRDESPGEGGYVYAEPGMYQNVVLLDVVSMHPTSIVNLNAFGEYTPRFKALLDARVAIKNKDFGTARKLLDGALAPYLKDETTSSELAFALKIVINIVYGLTSAKFDNPFRDLRNVDNIVAKRGALFMIDLKHFVQNLGYSVAHIKTDSIKIPDATPEIIEQVFKFGEKYGYKFEHEATYEQFCLVNDAVYVAQKKNDWIAVGAQFQHPYVFKTLFGDPKSITFDDLCETKSVTQGGMYLDFDSVSKPMALTDGDMRFVGRTGRFVPVKEGHDGAILYRVKGDKFYAVSGTKGHLWLEADSAKKLRKDAIDMTYFEKLVEQARDAIHYYGSFVK